MGRASPRVLSAVLVVGAVLLLLVGCGHGSPVATSSLTVGVEAPPPQPRGALVLAGESGTRAVALAVGQGRRLTATVLSPAGRPLSGLSVSFRTGNEIVRTRPCGPGCYGATAPQSARLGRIEVRPSGSRPVVFTLPATVRPGAAIVARAARVLRSLRSLAYVESLRSAPSGGIVTLWRMVAPDRLSYRIRGGAAAIVIGRRRWDQSRPGSGWARSQQIPPLRVPQPAWGRVTANAHLLGTTRIGGRPVWVVSFVNPTIPAWFTAWVDRESYRTLRLRMVAAAHFMLHRYVAFDRPLRITPPRANAR